MKSSSSQEIPEEVLFEILIRLPVKSLCRFQSVCPLWLSVISDSYFIRRHYSHSKTRSKLLVVGSRSGSTWKKWLIYDADRSELVRAGEFPSLWATSWYYPKPVHGLICVPLWSDCGGDMGILNPSTGEEISISSPQVSTGDSWCRYWFGFDPVSEKHKVIYTYETPKQYLEQWVYTLGSIEEWRRVGVLDRHHRKRELDEQVCIDGVIYYRVYDENYCLASFDLKSESFQMVELSFPGNEQIESYALIEFNGSIALVDGRVSDTNHRINVWVLEDFQKQVWKLKRSISIPDSWRETLISESFLKFGCTLCGGELLVFTPSRQDLCDFPSLFIWNTVSNNFRRSGIRVPAGNVVDDWMGQYLRYSDHVESLISLKAPKQEGPAAKIDDSKLKAPG